VKPKILIVDDDVKIARMLEMALRDDYQVVSAHQPKRALELFHSGDFDLVLTDIKMPELSGFDILRAVKETNPAIEVILLTGETPDKAEPAVKALQSGAHDYLLKPVRIKELKETIQSALSNQRRQLEDKRHLQELIRLAYTDYLTGLSNRHNFESQFKLEFERSDRYERPLSCMILDIDDFKRINDAFGHRTGDQVLKQIGTLILNNFRSSDLKCRYGGEEFVLLIPEADHEVAMTVAEKLRRIVCREIFTFTESPFQVTASVGVATCWRRNFKSASDLIHAADLALIKAKREGKNCVRVYASLSLHESHSPAPAKG